MSDVQCFKVYVPHLHAYGWWYPEYDNDTHCYVLVHEQLIWLRASEFYTV